MIICLEYSKIIYHCESESVTSLEIPISKFLGLIPWKWLSSYLN